eukprot:symbB.v1.2.010649.t1/scaffold701.1/size171414/5
MCPNQQVDLLSLSTSEGESDEEYVAVKAGKFDLDVVIAVEECACRFAFERYSEIAGLKHVMIAMSDSEMMTMVEDLCHTNRDRPLLLVVGERPWLAQLQSLSKSDRIPFVVDASDSGPSKSHAKLAASCTQKEFEDILGCCASWWCDVAILQRLLRSKVV